MFGLTRREQQWKADQQAAEALVPFAVAAIQAAAQVRIAEVQTDSEELARLRELADSEGSRAVEYLRRARKAEAEIERMRPALNAIAEHFDSSWPERCQCNVLTARHALDAGHNVRAKLTAEACVAWPRKENSTPALERPSNACRSGSA